MAERIIVSLTTYSKRISNLPAVLDSIFSQTLKPDFVVLNLAFEEVVPYDVQEYVESHPIEVNRVPDTKVYKKLIPTLRKYPDDCIITIDDDFLYPKEMIEEFVSIHRIWPEHPISGNNEFFFGIKCHCGCASLTKACYYGRYLEDIDNDVIKNCPSDDLVYSYLATKNGHPYIKSQRLYFVNMESYNEGEGYSVTACGGKEMSDSYNYLKKRFGEIDNSISKFCDYLQFINNEIQKDIFIDIFVSYFDNVLRESSLEGYKKGCSFVYSSTSYKLGNYIMKIGTKIRNTLLSLFVGGQRRNDG